MSEESKERRVWLGNLASSDRDWPEDYALENGQYMNRCYKCELTFIGYRGRFVCKSCYNAQFSPTVAPASPEPSQENSDGNKASGS